MKFIKDTALTFSIQLISVILGVITSIILARVLGPGNLGVYSLIILTFTLLGILGSFGITIANTYYGVKKKYKWNEIASNSLILAFAIGIILIMSFLIFLFLDHSFLGNIDLKLTLIPIITIPFILLISYFQYILLGQNRIKEFNFTNIIFSFLYLILIVIVFILNGNLFGVMISWTATYLISAIITLTFVYKSNPFKLQFNVELFKKSMNYGIKGYLSNVITFFIYRIDMYLISFILLDYASVGYYSVAVGLAESLWYLPGVVGTLIFARTPGLSDEENNKFTPKVCRNTLFITIILAVILFLTSRYIILILYGPQYLPVLEPLWVLIPGIVILSINKVLANEITGRGNPIIATYVSIITLIINVILNLIFIPFLGIVGSALASSISYTIASVPILAYFLKLSKSSLSETLILKKEDIDIYKKFLKSYIK